MNGLLCPFLAMPPGFQSATPPPALSVKEGYRQVRSLSGGQIDRFAVDLHAGEVLTGIASERGIDLMVDTFNADGKHVGHFDSSGGVGEERFRIVAATAGTYRFDIAALSKVAPAGRYVLSIPSILPAKPYRDLMFAQEFGKGSPMTQVAHQVAEQGSDGIDNVIERRRGKGPILEALPGHPDKRIVTFLYRGTLLTQGVYLASMFGALQPDPLAERGLTRTPFRRLLGSDLWYCREVVSMTARFGYRFAVERLEELPDGKGQHVLMPVATHPALIPDPLEASNWMGYSVLEMPKAPPQPWIQPHPDVPQGNVTEIRLPSRLLGETRKIGVYTPAAYARSQSDCALAIVFDGERYGLGKNPLVPTPTVLDNLIYRRRIGPTIAVLVDSLGERDRDRDLGCSRPFADFLAKELLPWVRTHYRVSHDPAKAVLAGSSLGGVCSAYVASCYPSLFGNVLSQSGAFWVSHDYSVSRPAWKTMDEPEWLIQRFVSLPHLPIKWYLDVGIYEGELWAANRHLRDVLRLKGYAYSYVEHAGFNNSMYWRNSIGDGLITLLGKP